MTKAPKPPALRGLLGVLKHARAELLGERADGDWQGTIDELERTISRVERYLKAYDLS